MSKTYIIGDVHGNYATLLALIEKLPKDAQLIFVGDLIDRGEQSAKVVKLVRENNYLCVMGNHEEQMFTYGYVLASAYENNTPLPQHNIWYNNGGIETLLSYALIKLVDGKPDKVEDFTQALKQFKDDMKWMESLPLYIELESLHVNDKPVVISHAPIDSVWSLRNIDSMYSTFHRMATTNRRDPDESTKIFNIFGHTPVRWGVEVTPYYVKVDTGCYIGKNGYNQLSAYGVETNDVISMEYIKESSYEKN